MTTLIELKYLPIKSGDLIIYNNREVKISPYLTICRGNNAVGTQAGNLSFKTEFLKNEIEFTEFTITLSQLLCLSPVKIMHIGKGLCGYKLK